MCDVILYARIKQPQSAMASHLWSQYSGGQIEGNKY